MVVKRLDLLKDNAINYALVCEASLRSDMAKRIMYSILPALSGETQMQMTHGAVDYKALKAAVEGRKDIIKYGIKACAKEIDHYQKDGQSKARLMNQRYLEGNAETAIDMAIQCFADAEHWAPSYGGQAWENVAKTLKKSMVLDGELEKAKAARMTDPTAIDRETEIMRQLVITMNIFDGLSHNTESILSNMAHEEALESAPSPAEAQKAGAEEFKTLQRLMDAKELTNPVQVFKEVEPALIESGDIHRYKDWANTLRRNPSYSNDDPGLEKEKFLIRLRKHILPFRQELNDRRDFLKKQIEKSLVQPSWINVEPMVDEFAAYSDRLLLLIQIYYLSVPDFSQGLKEGLIKKIQEDINKIGNEGVVKIETVQSKFATVITKLKRQKLNANSPQLIDELKTANYEVIKSIYEAYGRLVFYLDSI